MTEFGPALNAFENVTSGESLVISGICGDAPLGRAGGTAFASKDHTTLNPPRLQLHYGDGTMVSVE